MTKQRKIAIRIAALRYLADHMSAVIDIDPGPHEIVTDEEEDQYLVQFIQDEASKLRSRAARTKS